jgi:hypothetical protein
VKHVYVETNFIVDLLRPFPSKGARDLALRNGADLVLHVPWCALTEAKRTLEGIIRVDLGFVDNAGRFLRELGAARDRAIATMRQEVIQFIHEGRAARRDALFDFVDRLSAFARGVNVLKPSESAAQRAVDLFRRKSLTPFDEMIVATVLVDAAARHERGEGPLFFSSLNTRDFEPTSGNDLGREYGRAGLTYLPTFKVP